MLKENWTSKDKLSYSDFNLIVNNIIKLCNKLNIQIPEQYEKLQYRKIEIGDDLSNKTLYLNFDEDVSYNSFIATQGYPENIIISENRCIYEDIYYMDGFYKALTMKNYEETEFTDIYRYYEGDYLSGKSPEVNLKQLTLPNDFGSVTTINKESYFYNNMTIKTEEIQLKSLGDFLYKENLQIIEDTLKNMCDKIEIKYNRKIWSHLSLFNFKDVNRWCSTLNYFTSKKNILLENGDRIIAENGDRIIMEVFYG